MFEKIKEILSMPLTTSTIGVGRMSRFAIFQVKLWYHCAKLLKTNRVRQQAAALSYYTIFGIVPLAIVTMLIFNYFPVFSQYRDNFKNLIYEKASLTILQSTSAAEAEQSQITNFTEQLDKLIGKFFTGTYTGTITAFSVLSVIFAAISFLSTIEKTFNGIFHVTQMRSYINRVVNYWALLTLGPMLIGAGIYVSTYSMVSGIQKQITSTLTPGVISYLIVLTAFFLLYLLMPNTKVRFKAAIWGAAVAALIWIIAQAGFQYLIVNLKLYHTIYGFLALIPITVLWIFITWLIVIFGLQLVYTTQNLQSLDKEQIANSKKTEEYFIANDISVINIVTEVTSAFEKNNAPIEENEISSKLNIAPEFCDKILNHLVSKGILARTSEPKAGLLPARDPQNIKLSEITDAVASAGVQTTDQSPVLQQVMQSQKELFSRFNVKQLADNA